MKSRTIIIYKHAPPLHPPAPDCDTVSFNDLIRWYKTGRIVSSLFRYTHAELHTAHRSTLIHPLASAWMVRLLSRNRCVLRDEQDQVESLTVVQLLRFMIRFLVDGVQKPFLIRRAFREVRSLQKKGTNQPVKPVQPDPPVLYLRTDLGLGLKAGGSVGHTAGILNELQDMGYHPIFVTTERLPTVDPAIETHLLTPPQRFWDFLEVPSIYFNRTLERQIEAILGGRIPALLYQRYSINHYAGVALAERYSIPLVLEYNGSEIWMSRHWGTPYRYESLAEEIELLNLQKAGLIVVCSRAMQEELLQRGIPEHRILVNPNGVNPDLYSPKVDGSSVRERYNLHSQTVIGFIGTFGRWHGVEGLVEAFAQLLDQDPFYRRSVKLLLVGDGATMPDVKQRVVKYALQEHVVFTGTVSQEEGPRYLAACDILVSPQIPNPDGSPFFGSPTKLFEYMAMGKGIVASDLDQISEILQHRQTGWLTEPGHVDSQAQGLKTLIDDPDLRRLMGQKARTEVVSKYTWSIHTQRILKRLEQMDV